MKRILAVITVIALIVLAGCEDMGSPITFPSNGERWAGTFDIRTAYPNGELFVQTGTISISFADTVYTYTGEVEFTSHITGRIPAGGRYRLNDGGRYERINGSVSLEDGANRRMVAWAPSLYLLGNFAYRIQGGTLTIEQAISGKSLVLVLHREN